MDVKRIAFATPLNFLKKVKDRNNEFAWGIIFGAVFSLIVNIITVQITDVLQAQRVMEAIESEIFTNKVTADGVVTENNMLIEDGAMPNYYVVSRKYVSAVWGSSEILKYSMRFPSALQARLSVFYTYTLPFENDFLDRNTELSKEKLANCYFVVGTVQQQKEDCLGWYKVYLNGEILAATAISDTAKELMQVYHPTRDRLANRWLRLLMGSEALGGLTVEPKNN